MQTHASYNEAFFKRLIRRYDFFVCALRPFRRKVAILAEVSGGSKVLDVACGTGEQTKAFADTGASVTGIDLSQSMLSIARPKLVAFKNVQLLHADASKLPFEDSFFDVSSVSLGLHDMPHDLAIAVLQEMKRVTKPGGKILIVEHHKPRNPLGLLLHTLFGAFDTKYFHAFMDKGLDGYLKEVGLQPEQREYAALGVVELVVCLNEEDAGV